MDLISRQIPKRSGDITAIRSLTLRQSQVRKHRPVFLELRVPIFFRLGAVQIIADTQVVAYLGTYNSGAAKLSIPILNASCLVMFSPANSYPGLTKAVTGVTTPGEPDSYYPAGFRNYARDINTDDVQGAAFALRA